MIQNALTLQNYITIHYHLHFSAAVIEPYKQITNKQLDKKETFFS